MAGTNKLDSQWAKAKRVCRLNAETIRMAKALGMSPRSLMKNVPSKSQRWKAPVHVWVRDLYEAKLGKARCESGGSAKQSQRPSPGKLPQETRDWDSGDLHTEHYGIPPYFPEGLEETDFRPTFGDSDIDPDSEIPF